MSKLHCSYKIEEEIVEKLENCYEMAGCRYKSEFVEKAIAFYCGYVTSENYRDYYPSVIVDAVKGNLDNMENRMASLLFKMAVELAINTHVTASLSDIEESTLTRLRGECVEEVKRLNGRISFDEAHRHYKE